MSDNDQDKPDAISREIRAMELIAEWESMKARGVLYEAWEQGLDMMSRNRKERRAAEKRHPNPYKEPRNG